MTAESIQTRPVKIPDGIDVSVPNRARMHDFMLGGTDNAEPDRTAVDFVSMAVPGVREGVVTHREFLGRVLRHLAGEAGLTQFLDIGAGLPTCGNTHEVVHAMSPSARVVYVDNDPQVVLHGQSVLGYAAGPARYIEGDIREPEQILGHREVTGFIDLSQPVAVLVTAVLQFIEDSEDPYRKVSALMAAVAPGSRLVVSHATRDPAASSELSSAFDSGAITRRSREQTLRFFEGLELVEPGLVDLSTWRPDGSADTPSTSAAQSLGGVAVKR